MIFDESKVTRDDQGRFSRKGSSSKSNGRAVSGTAGRSKINSETAGIFDLAPYGQKTPKNKPGTIPG